MSEPHLTTGSSRPPLVDGKLRLYSMEFCPYAQRVRLVLRAKNIPHDIVNINLTNKPDWYFEIHPEGKVPAIDTGSKVIVESLDISDYLDEKYPGVPLYPKDPKKTALDKELIQKLGLLIGVFSKAVFQLGKQDVEKLAEEFKPHLNILEQELVTRRSVYFGGAKPGMVDYMLWPWGERAGTVALALGEKLPFGDNEFPLLRKWCRALREDPPASGIYHGPEKFWNLVERKLKNLPPDYEKI